jgi:hypothetical protein
MTTAPTTTVFETLWDTPMSNRGHIRFDARTNTVTLVGRAHGKVTALSMKSDAVLGGNVIVLHEEGSSYWRARGESAYAPAEVSTILVEFEPRSIGGGVASYHYVTLTNPVEVKGNATSRSDATARVIARLGADL